MKQADIAKRFVEELSRCERRTLVAVVEGRSMGKTLPSGTKVKVLFEEAPALRRSQIVCIRRPTKLVIHRLVLLVGPWCLEKGDRNWCPGICRRCEIVGVAVEVLRNEKWERI